MSIVAVVAAGSQMELGVVALMAFGLVVVGLFGRFLDGGRRKHHVRRTSAASRPLQAHGPRHTGGRRPRASTSITDADRLQQLDRLIAKGHITPEDYSRTKGELQTHRFD